LLYHKLLLCISRY